MKTTEIILQAFKLNASDVHITVGRPPSFRMNGILYAIDAPEKKIALARSCGGGGDQTAHSTRYRYYGAGDHEAGPVREIRGPGESVREAADQLGRGHDPCPGPGESEERRI